MGGARLGEDVAEIDAAEILVGDEQEADEAAHILAEDRDQQGDGHLGRGGDLGDDLAGLGDVDALFEQARHAHLVPQRPQQLGIDGVVARFQQLAGRAEEQRAAALRQGGAGLVAGQGVQFRRLADLEQRGAQFGHRVGRKLGVVRDQPGLPVEHQIVADGLVESVAASRDAAAAQRRRAGQADLLHQAAERADLALRLDQHGTRAAQLAAEMPAGGGTQDQGLDMSEGFAAAQALIVLGVDHLALRIDDGGGEKLGLAAQESEGVVQDVGFVHHRLVGGGAIHPGQPVEPAAQNVDDVGLERVLDLG